MPRWGERSRRNYFATIDAARTRTDLVTLLHALGVPHVGRGTAEILATELGCIAAVQAATLERLEQLPNVGSKTALAVHTWFRSNGGVSPVTKVSAFSNDKKLRPSLQF